MFGRILITLKNDGCRSYNYLKLSNYNNNDTILALSVGGSMSAGILFPTAGSLLEPYSLVWLGAMLFVNLIRLNTSDLVSTFTRPKQLVTLSTIKLVALPIALYVIVDVIYPQFALPVLLLTGISTGLGAPFVANQVDSNLSLVVGMIITTSLAMPFVLPVIAYELVGTQFSISVSQMVTLLSAALFMPLAAGWLTKKYLPTISKFADRNSFALSQIFIVLMNFGIFAKFSHYFYTNQLFLFENVLIACLCYIGYGVIGYFVSRGSGSSKSGNGGTRHFRENAVAGFISMSYVNNMLVTVFALQFFGSQVAALAALYNIPYYAGIIVMKKIMTHKVSSPSSSVRVDN
jgi:BASS family bile acid:Na+ symporter